MLVVKTVISNLKQWSWSQTHIHTHTHYQYIHSPNNIQSLLISPFSRTLHVHTKFNSLNYLLTLANNRIFFFFSCVVNMLHAFAIGGVAYILARARRSFPANVKDQMQDNTIKGDVHSLYIKHIPFFSCQPDFVGDFYIRLVNQSFTLNAQRFKNYKLIDFFSL